MGLSRAPLGFLWASVLIYGAGIAAAQTASGPTSNAPAQTFPVGTGANPLCRQPRGKSEKEAEELVDTVDQERADFIRRDFNVDWPDRGRLSQHAEHGNWRRVRR